jgi:hypothetical protein
MTVSSSSGTGSTGSSEMTSQLEGARAKSTKARESLDQAKRKVEEIDGRLGRNAARTSQDEAILRAAEAQVKQLKRALKDASKERQKLLTDRKRATAAVDKAQDKARSSEAKYDRAVLADLIQREKQQDRRAAGPGSTGSSDGSPVAALPSTEDQAAIPLPAGPVGSADATSGDSGAAAPDGSAEPEDLGTATARATAARTTAEAAGNGAEPAQAGPGESPTSGFGGDTTDSGGDTTDSGGDTTETGEESRQNL